MKYFLQGLTMGLAYVAPIGVQNLFAMNTALTSPGRRALRTAWIIVFFDVTLALACFFGVGAVMQRFAWLQPVILLAGSILVLRIGWGLIRSQETAVLQGAEHLSWRKTVWKACAVTWFNPQAILDGTMMLGAFRAALPAAQAGAFIAGVAAASWTWFTAIALILSKCSGIFQAEWLRWIDRICGVVIMGYGLRLAWSFFA